MGGPVHYNQDGSATTAAQGEEQEAAAAAVLTPEQQAANAVVLNPGTSYATTTGAYNADNNRFHPLDPRNYQYGRSATGADEAVTQAKNTGDSAFATGSNILTNDLNYAQDARNRVAPTGDFANQNGALTQSINYANQSTGQALQSAAYGQQLANLENTQGPSAAQAQLSAGTNQALSSQLALARSGRGFGGGAAAMGQAQSNVAGIQANQANQAATLRAQEDAAWRSRQATNYGNAAGISQGAASSLQGAAGALQGAGTQFGQQATTNLSAGLQSQAQNDATALNYSGQGATAYGNGVTQNLSGQSLQNNIRQSELGAGEATDDRALRAWAAERGFALQQQQRNDAQTAALIQGGATVVGGVLGTVTAGPAGGVTGATLANQAAKAATA
jgi:hypothetical protein